MATEKTDVILSVQVNGDNAIATLAKYQKEIDDLKKSQKDYKTALKEGKISQDEYYQSMAKAGTEIDLTKAKLSAVKKEMKNQIKATTESNGSLASMRAELSNLTKKYDGLSASERANADIGGKLQTSITGISDKLKTAEAETGRFNRNVGDYKNQVSGAMDSSKLLTSILGKMGVKSTAVTAAVTKLANPMKKIGFNAGEASTPVDKLTQSVTNLNGQASSTVGGANSLNGGMRKIGFGANEASEKTDELTNSVGGLDQIGGPAVAKVTSLGKAAQTAGGVMPLLKGGIAQVGMALKALLANPVVAILAAVVGAVMLAVKAVNLLNGAIESSEDMSARNEAAMARSQQRQDQWTRVKEKGALVLIKFREQLEKGIQAFHNVVIAFDNNIQKAKQWAEEHKIMGTIVKGLLAPFNLLTGALHAVAGAYEESDKATREYQQLAIDNAKLVKAQRTVAEETAKRDTEIARLRAIAADTENVSAAKRLEALKKANALAMESANAEKANAKEKLRLLEIEGTHTKNNAEFNDKLSAAKIDVYNADKNLFSMQKYLNRTISTATKEIEAETKAEEAQATAIKEKAIEAMQAKIQAQKDAKAEETSIIEETNNLIIASMTEGFAKQRAVATAASAKKTADLTKRLEDDKTLTDEARASLNKQIELERSSLVEGLASIDAQELAQTEANEQAKLAIKLKYANKTSDEAYNLQKQQLDNERQVAIESAAKQGLDVEAVKTYYDGLEQARILKFSQDKLTAEANEFSAKMQMLLNQAEIEGATTAELAMIKHQAELERKKIELDEMHIMEGETNDAYDARVLAAQVALKEAQDAVRKSEVAEEAKDIEAEKKLQQAKLRAFASVSGALDAISQASGDQSKEMLVASKAIALASVYMSQGVAIANAIKTATSSSPDTFTMIANIATAVTSVVTSTVSAFKAIKKADSATSSNNMATGGYVSGAGTATSDSIPTNLSNGESVNNANSTAMFSSIYSMLNQAGGGVPINAGSASDDARGEQMLANAFAKGVAAMPSPVVSVEDITTANDRVSVIDTIAKLN